MRAAESMEDIHVKVLPQIERPHWTLLALLVKPDLRNKGLGSEVLLPVIRSSDEATLPIFTTVYHYENQPRDEKFINFLKRHGFDVKESGKESPKYGPPFTILIRYAY